MICLNGGCAGFPHTSVGIARSICEALQGVKIPSGNKEAVLLFSRLYSCKFVDRYMHSARNREAVVGGLLDSFYVDTFFGVRSDVNDMSKKLQ